MDQGRKVWAPDVKDGFILGEIADFGADTLTVQPLDGGKVSLNFSSSVEQFLSLGPVDYRGAL